MTSSNPSPGRAPGLPDATDTPVLRLYREQIDLTRCFNERPLTTDEAETDRLFAELCDLETRMFAEPSTCAADMAAKLLVLDDFADVPLGKALQAECQALVREVL